LSKIEEAKKSQTNKPGSSFGLWKASEH